jgi:3-methyl-2-oxobutanoate hydroxymethyltransferase
MAYKATEHVARVTTQTLRKMKAEGEKFAMVTSYDASFTVLLEQSGVEVLLVGDSLGMVIQGHDTTVPVSVDDIVYHCACVARASSSALLMADMPFMSYSDTDSALYNAARLMQEGGAQMVKLEGGGLQTGIVNAMTERGIPVCAHLGLTPQSVHKLGGYRVQGRGDEAARLLLGDAIALEEAGADLLLLECVPAILAEEVTRNLKIPVIGIGAGSACDGQVLVVYDMLGITPGKRPKFSKDFLAETGSLQKAIEAYVAGVKAGSFPGSEHEFE